MNSVVKIDGGEKNILSGVGEREGKFLYRLGEIINAAVAKIADGRATLITDSGFAFEAEAENIGREADAIGREVGDRVSFEVISSDKSGMTLRQILAARAEERVNTKQLSDENLRGLMSQNNLLAETSNRAEDDRVKTAEAISKIRRQLNYTRGNLTASAVRELVANGVSLEKITIDVLNTALLEMEAKPAADIKNSGADIQNANGAARRLASFGLPANGANVAALESVADKLERVSKFDAESVYSLLKNDTELTLENIYIAKFSSVAEQNPPVPARGALDELRPQLMRALASGGAEAGDDLLTLAESLVARQIPVNKTNIEKAEFLFGLGESVLAEKDAILDAACENIKKGRPAASVVLYPQAMRPVDTDPSEDTDYYTELYENLVPAVRNIAPEQIDLLLYRKIPLTLHNLIVETSGAGPIPRVPELTARRELAEIQLKLTREAALRLAGKRVDISVMPLEEAVRNLRAAEREVYAASLRLTGPEAETPANIDAMSSLFDKLENFNDPPVAAFGPLIVNRTALTVEAAHARIAAAKALPDYETFATVADPKYGDGFASIRDRIEPFLAGISAEPDEDNITAAAVLIKNNLDVTDINLTSVKALYRKLNAVYDRLTPNAAAAMLNEGINPANAHIDDVLAYIDLWNEIYGVSASDKIAERLLEADENKTLDAATRESVVAVYRMLNIIKKEGAVALGVIVKSGAPATLGRLMDGAKYFQKTRGKKSAIDAVVDDGSGVSEFKTPGANIRGLLASAYERAVARLGAEKTSAAREVISETIMADNAANLIKAADVLDQITERPAAALLGYELTLINLDRVIDGADLETLARFVSEDGAFADTDVERAAAALEELIKRTPPAANDSERYDELIARLNEVGAGVAYMLRESGVAPTVANLVAANGYARDPDYLRDSLSSLPADELEPMSEALSGEFDPELTGLSRALAALQNDSADAAFIKRIGQMRNAIKVSNSFNAGGAAGEYFVPVKLHDKIGTLRVRVTNPDALSKRGARVFMSLDMTGFGNVSAYLTVSDGRRVIKIDAETHEAAEFLRGGEAELAEAMVSAGAASADLTFGDVPNEPARTRANGGSVRRPPNVFPGGTRRLISRVINFIDKKDMEYTENKISKGGN